MDSDEEDFVFYGTPIEREEELSSRKKKAVAESSGQLRSLPAWKQEVRDEEGRRRFHGAFTGGFSAGYYNTVGSKEGWTPQSFTSSRKNRAEVKQQSILNFLDDDEKSELEGRSLSTSSQFDTFGFTAAEHARKQAEKEQQHRHSAIPGPVPDEIVLPVTESIGVKLLKKMGWRQGHSIKDSHPQSVYDVRREARKAFLALASEEAKDDQLESKPLEVDYEKIVALPDDENVQPSESTPVYVLNPKQDLHGLGYDPYKHAPEFREKKRLHTSGGREHGYNRSTRDRLLDFKRRNSAPGFGIGALEELDAEDEDVYASGFDFESSVVEEVEEALKPSLGMPDKPRLTGKDNGVLPGFRLASNTDYQLQRFDPPAIPKDFVPQHKFSQPIEANLALYDPPPPEGPPPEDSYVKLLIDGLATLVARCGKLFEDLSREKHQTNPLFGFLNGGNFHDYYARKVWEEKQKCNQRKPQLERKSQSVQNMTAEHRGRILGESPLERSATIRMEFQSNLLDTFTKPTVGSELLDVSKPFRDDPAKQERFEQFLQEKYYGGLRSSEPGGTSIMTESARARERLDFEAAAEAIEKCQLGGTRNASTGDLSAIASSSGMQFISGGLQQGKSVQAETLMTNAYPKREEFQWRPSPILCKRFDLVDPYMGKPAPAPRARSKVDSLFFLPDVGAMNKADESTAAIKTNLSALSKEIKQVNEKEPEVEVEVENIERPVDLYKAIFSDDSDEEGDDSISKGDNPEKKGQAATAALNRLMAGDFLESLGKELGLEVPADQPVLLNKAGTSNPREGGSSANFASSKVPALDDKPSSFDVRADNKSIGKSFENNGCNVLKDSRMVMNDNKDATPSSSEERSGKGSKRGPHSSDSDGDMSSDHREQHPSSSKKKRRERESSHSRRHRSRKHSKHRKHRDRDSSERSSHRSGDRNMPKSREKR